MGAAAVPVAMMAIAAAGTAISVSERNKYARQQSKAAAEQAELERIRQKKYQDQASATFGDTLNQFREPQQAVANTEAVGKREATLGDLVAGDTASPVPIDQDSPGGRVVASDLAKRMAEAVGKGKTQASQLAKLGSFGDVSFGNQLALAQGGSRLGDIMSGSQGSLRLLDPSQTGAMAAVRPPSGFGDILQGVGNLGMMGSMAYGGNWSGRQPYGTTGPNGTLRGSV